MQKINWRPKGCHKFAKANIGNIVISCQPFYGRNTWYVDVSIYNPVFARRLGPVRKSLFKAKEDGIQIARELLLDCHASILIEMKNFDLITGE